MSTPIQEKIVKLTMQYSAFQNGANKVKGLLNDITTNISKLKKVDTSNASKGMQDIGTSAAGSVSGMNELGASADQVSGKFSALKTMATGALLNIGATAANKAMGLIKSITLDPIMDGFHEYETKMGSIQTILANTSKYGTTIDDVTKSLDNLNLYADKTIYSFSDMTRNIGLFTNAGIGLESATSMIKGFSNEAAASGTNASGAANAAYQLSQALSAGTIRLMDWRSLTNAGMGNKNMQEGLIQIGQAMGRFNDDTTTAEAATKDFNSSLESTWLSADVMSNYLQIMAGDMDDAKMAALGLSKEQIEAFKKQQKTAEEAATKVRSFTQLIGTLGEAVGSGWSQTWEILFGGFYEATDLFTGINNAISPIISGLDNLRNGFLQAFKDAKGLEAIKGIFSGLWKIISDTGTAIKDSWKSVTSLGEGMGKLPNLLTIPFKIISAIVNKIAEWQVIPKIIGTAFKVLFTVLSPVAKLLMWTGSTMMAAWNKAVDIFNKVVKAIKNTWKATKDLVTNIKEALKFDAIGNSLLSIKEAFQSFLIEPIKAAFDAVTGFGKALKQAFVDISFKPIQEWADNVKKSFKDVWKGITTFDFGAYLTNLKDAAVELFGQAKDKIADMFGSIKDSITKNSLIAWLGKLKDSMKGFKGFDFGGVGVKLMTIDPIKDLVTWWGKLGDKVDSLNLGDKFKDISNKFKEFKLAFSFDSIVEKFNKFYNVAKDFITGIDFSPLVDPINRAKDALVKFFSAIYDWGKKVLVIPAFDTIQNGVQKVINWFGKMDGKTIGNSTNKALKGIGDTATKMGDKAKSASDKLHGIFTVLGDWAKQGLKLMGEGLRDMWNGLVEGVKKIGPTFEKVKSTVVKVFTTIGEWLGKIKKWLGDTFSTEHVLKGGFLVYLLLLLKSSRDFVKNTGGIAGKIKDMFGSFSDVGETFKKVLGDIGDSFKNFGNKITPANILKIAGAIAILALSLKLMSTIKGEDVGKTIGLLAGALGSLLIPLGTMKLLGDIQGLSGTVKAIDGLAGAIFIIAASLKMLASVDPEKMEMALTTLLQVSTGIAIAMLGLSKLGPDVSVSIKGMMGIATALLILTGVIKILGSMDGATLLQGGGSVILLLLAIGGMLKLAGKDSKVAVGTGLAIMAIANALKTLAEPVKKLGEMDFEDLKRGMTAIGLGLAGMVGALVVMDKWAKGAKGSSTALLIAATALNVMAVPISILGKMSLATLGKGLGTVVIGLAAIVGSLVILSKFAPGAIAGAGAIAATAGALNLLVVPITLFGTMKLSTLALGMGTLVVALGLLVGVGYLAEGAAPGLLAIAAAIGAVGLAAGAVAIAVAAFITLLEWLTDNTKDKVKTVVDNIAEMVESVAARVPDFVDAAIKMVEGFLEVLVAVIPDIANAGLDILVALLQGISDHIGDIVTTVADIITTFLTALATKLPSIIQAGIFLMVQFILGMANGVRDNAEIIIGAVMSMMEAIAEVIITTLQMTLGNLPFVGDKIKDLGDKAKGKLREVFNVDETNKIAADASKGFTDGIGAEAPAAGVAAEGVAGAAKDGISTGDFATPGIIDGVDFTQALGGEADGANGAGSDVAGAGLDGLGGFDFSKPGSDYGSDFGEGIGSQEDFSFDSAELLANSGIEGLDSVDASASGLNFGQGFANGISGSVDAVKGAASWIGEKASGILNWVLDEHSPSRVTAKSGKFFSLGFAGGITDKAKEAINQAKTMAVATKDALIEGVQDVNDKMYQVLDTAPTVTPIIDTSGVKMDDISQYTDQFRNTKFEGAITFESTLLDKFESFKDDIKDTISAIQDRSIVVENSMDGKVYGKIVAKPVTEEQKRIESFQNKLYGRG